MKYCSNCGKEISDEISFCPNCGVQIHLESEVVEDFNDDISASSFPNNTLVIYFILNFILMMGNSNSDEIMGIFIYTWIVLAIIFFRRHKEKPFNLFLNIFVFLQAVIVLATTMMTLEYVADGANGLGVLVQLALLVLLLISIIVLLYKGNRRLA